MSTDYYREEWPGRRWALRLGGIVCGDLIFSGARASGVDYEHEKIAVNRYGAVAVLADDGKMLGLKPDEFTWVSPPPWPRWPEDNRRCNACGKTWGGPGVCWNCQSTDVRDLP